MSTYLICVIIAVWAGATTTLADDLPVGRADTDLYYYTIRELYLRGETGPDEILFAPVSRDYIGRLSENNQDDRIIKISSPLNFLRSNDRNRSNLFNFSVPIVAYGSTGNAAPNTDFAIFPGLDYKMSDKVTIELAYRLDSGLNDDSLYTGKTWKGIAGYAESAILEYQGKKLSVDIGRRRSNWGIARNGNTLLLSKPAMPLDGIFVNYRVNKAVSFHFISGFLSRINMDETERNDNIVINRYLSMHALRISPAKWLDLVFKESVIYGGPGRRLEFNYAIPFLWFHGEQLNENFDDNTLLGMEAILRLQNKFAAYFEILVDDYQIENNTLSDNEPNEIGYVVGFDIFDMPVNSSSLEIEYSRIANYTYNQVQPFNRYMNHDRPIGHPLGPDFETIAVSYIYHFRKNLRVELGGHLLRRGEGRINDTWEAPWIYDPSYKESFPSGVVEKTTGGTLGIWVQKGAVLQGEISLSYNSINNHGNLPGVERNLWSVDFKLIVTALGLSGKP